VEWWDGSMQKNHFGKIDGKDGRCDRVWLKMGECLSNGKKK
jgi:hypothetical protein